MQVDCIHFDRVAFEGLEGNQWEMAKNTHVLFTGATFYYDFFGGKDGSIGARVGFKANRNDSGPTRILGLKVKWSLLFSLIIDFKHMIFSSASVC